MVFESDNKNEQSEDRLRRSVTVSVKHRTRDGSNSTIVSKPSSQSTPAVRNSFIAGLTAGITGTLVGHPLDSLKVWLQTGQRPNVVAAANDMAANASKGILSSIRRSYAGVAGPVLTVGLIQSINFAAYDSMRRFWYYNYEDPNWNEADKAYLSQDSFASVAVSGIAAGAVVSAITQPVMMVKTKQQTQNMKFAQAIRHSMRHPFVGFGTHFFVETANRSIYFVTYEALKRKYTGADGTTSMATRMLSASVAGIACWVFIYPTDVIRSRLYSASADNNHMNFSQCIRKMYTEQGWKSFFKGFTVTTLRAGPVAAFILPVYDVVLDQLNKLSA